MNKLAKKPNDDTNASFSGQSFVLNTALLLLATALIHSAVALYYRPWYQSVLMAGSKAPAIVELANEAVCDKVDSLRRQLIFMARQPVLRDLQPANDVENTLLKVREVAARLTTIIEPFVGLAYGELRSQYNNLLYWADIPRAFGLAILFDTGLFGTEDEFLDFFASSKDYLSTHEEMLSEVNVARNVMAGVNAIVDAVLGRVNVFAAFYGHFSASGARIPVDEGAARNFMAAALTDFNDFRALALKSLNGTIRAQAFSVSTEFLSSEKSDVNAISSNAAFYAGSVISREGGSSPLWHIAVPVRNSNREPVACLSALVDLGFLSSLSEISTGESNLVFADRSGKFISGADRIISHGLHTEVTAAAMSVDARGFFRLSDHDSNNAFIAGKLISSDKYRFLPSWAVIICGSLTSFGASADKGILMAVFLLAALGCFALFYSIPAFFKLVVKEQK